MSEPRFTEGPWEVKTGYLSNHVNKVVKNGSFPIVTFPPGYPLAQRNANAYLCAAAPELYLMLVDAVKRLDAAYTVIGKEKIKNGQIEAIFKPYREVLRKARGELNK